MEGLMDEPASRWRRWPMWLIIAVALAFLYVPLVPSLVASLQGVEPGQWTLRWYGELWRTPLVLGAFRTSAMIAVLVGILAPLLGLLAAMSIRELGVPRFILLAMLLPLFIPGVSMGLASAFLFRLLGIAPSLATIVIVQTLWALPFATLIILTAMTTFDPQYLEAAYLAGAGRWRAFRDVELPLIASGITGAISFSAILSINETIRTSAVQGPWNTVPTYIWSTYRQVGLSPVLYALMGLIIIATVVIVLSFLLLGREARPR
jgi:ABC-type spermidine/putrescine transport system permease subunit II